MTRIDVRSDIGQFAIIPEWVLDQELSPTAVRLYCVLALMADRKTATSFSSRAYLAKRCQCSVRHIARALIELKQAGALYIQHRWKKDPSGEDSKELETNLYTVICSVPGMSLPRDAGVLTPRDTRGTDNQRVSEPESSEDSSEEESSSSSEDEEDFMTSLSRFYHSLPTQLFLSSVQAPGPYFRKLHQNGDQIPPCDLGACLELAQTIHDAVNVGYPDQKILAFPTPVHLTGLAEAAPVLKQHEFQPQHLRLALYQFCQYDGGPEELSGSDILERIAKRPDRFAEALTQLSASLG